jgi:hypothetical protein
MTRSGWFPSKTQTDANRGGNTNNAGVTPERESAQADGVRDDAEPEAVEAALAVRIALLHVATLYGLRAAIVDSWPDSCMEWGVLVDWVGEITSRFDGMASAQKQALSKPTPGARLMRQLTQLLGELETSGELSSTETMRSRHHDWANLLENLAMTSRWVERCGLVPMAEAEVETQGVDLLGALQDSLVLLSYGDEPEAALCAGPVEIHGLIHAAREAGAWDVFEAQPVTGRSSGEMAVKPESPDWTEEWPEVLDFISSASGAWDIHRRLHLDGRELSSKERAHAISSVREGASAMRKLVQFSLETRLPTSRGAPDTNLRSTMAVVRMLHRSFTLALSGSSDRRALAVLPTEVPFESSMIGESGLRERLLSLLPLEKSRFRTRKPR